MSNPWIDLDTPTKLAVHWGWLLITRANFVVYVLVVAVFLVGAFVRLPGVKKDLREAQPPGAAAQAPPRSPSDDEAAADRRNYMAAVRRYAEKYWPYDRLLPSDEPIFVSRVFYMFGSLALASLVCCIASGVILVFKGPIWWHTSPAGLFVNSLHFWSVQLLFFAIFVHFGSSFFTAAWRGGRALTWVLGVLTFLTAVTTGLTGYVSQTNFDSQYIGQQAKDALNAMGLGYVLNLMSFDSIIGWHIVILPLGVVLILALHLLWVRRHGVVTPFPAAGTDDWGVHTDTAAGQAQSAQGPPTLDAARADTPERSAP